MKILLRMKTILEEKSVEKQSVHDRNRGFCIIDNKRKRKKFTRNYRFACLMLLFCCSRAYGKCVCVCVCKSD